MAYDFKSIKRLIEPDFKQAKNTIEQGLMLADVEHQKIKAAISSAGLNNIVEDLTPQLGGALDMNGYAIGGNSEAELDDAVAKKHAQNTDTALGSQSENLNMNTHKIVGVVDPTSDQEAATKKYVDDHDCPVYIYIKATAQAEGDLHLLDNTNWNTSKAEIKVIRIITSSTDWDLYILQNDNSFVTDDANIPKIQIMDAGNGNANIYLGLPYQDEDASKEVHLYYLDNSGANTADIYILGIQMR